MHRPLALAVLMAVLCCIPTMTVAKNVTCYGNDSSFWKNHVLVVATVDGVEDRSEQKFHVRLRVAECVPPRFPFGNRVTAEYEVPSDSDNANFGNLLNGLKTGDKVMVLLRPSYGRVTLPNGMGEVFAMMPDRGAPLYRVASADDPNVSDTTRIVKACTTENLSQRIVAIGATLQKSSSRHVKHFAAQYLELLVRDTESDLQNARTLLEKTRADLKHSDTGTNDRTHETDRKSSKPNTSIKKGTPESRARRTLDSFLAGNLDEFSVPDTNKVERGKSPKLPASRWPIALEAVRKGMAKEFGDMTLKEDRRHKTGAPDSHLFRYRHNNDGLDIDLLRYNTPREAGEALRVSDLHVSVKTISTRPGEEFRLKGVGDEAYRYFPSGTVIMCYSNVFVLVKGQPADIKAKAARVIANCLENVAELATPKMLDPEASDAEKAKHGARLVADYALVVEGFKEINEGGRVKKAAGNKWTVQYDKLDRTVTVHALFKDDADFKRLDKDANGQIDHRDVDLKKILKTLRTDQYDKTVELKEAADLLRRIDKRIEAIKGEHAGLSQWNEQIKTYASRYHKTHLVPYGWSSGKLVQFNLDSITPGHRLLYHSREERCSFSIRVIPLTGGFPFEPPHLKYARARLFVDSISADEKLRKELVWIIQEELFKEPGPAGIEKRARFAATPLAHLARTGKFLDMRWLPSHLKPVLLSSMATMIRDDNQLVFLCSKLDPGVAQYAILPVAVKVSRPYQDVE